MVFNLLSIAMKISSEAKSMNEEARPNTREFKLFNNQVSLNFAKDCNDQ